MQLTSYIICCIWITAFSYTLLLVIYSGLILRGENFKVFKISRFSKILLYPWNFHHEISDILHYNGIYSIFEAYLVIILKTLSVKSFTNQSTKISFLDINPPCGNYNRIGKSWRHMYLRCIFLSLIHWRL